MHACGCSSCSGRTRTRTGRCWASGSRRHGSDGPVRGVTVGASGDFVDADGHAREAYAPAGGELVAVRPDGHVGARGSETDVTAFLRGVLPAVPAEV